MSLLKKLAGQTALYGLSSMLGRALNFLLFPFYAAILQPAEFGIMTELYSHVALLNIIYLFGMETAYFTFSNREGCNEKEVFNNAETFLLACSILFSTVLILASDPIAEALSYPGKGIYVTWLAIILATDAVLAIPFAQLRYKKMAGRFAFIKILNIVLAIFLNIFFLVVCKELIEGEYLISYEKYIKIIYRPGNDVAYVFLSNLIANALLVPIFWKSFRNLRFAINIPLMRSMVIYAYPLLFMGLAGMINESFSRIILKRVLPEGFYPGRTNQEALGIFGACYRLSVLMSLAIQSFRYAAEPFFFSEAPDKNAPAVFAQVMKWFIITCLFLFLIVSLHLDIIGAITMKKAIYREGLYVVPWLLMANLFLGIYYNLSVWFKLTDRTYLGTYISIGGAFLTVVLNVILIPYLGFLGSALTTLVCYFLMSVVSYFLGQKYFPIPYFTGNAFFYIFLSVALFAVSHQIITQNGLLKHGLNFMLLLIYVLTVFLFEKKRLNFKIKPTSR